MLLFTFSRGLAEMSFGDWLLEKRTQARMSQDEVAERAKCSKTYVSNLERNLPHPRTGAPPQPSRDMVVALTMAVGQPVNDGLLAAGYAPRPDKIATYQEGEDGPQIPFDPISLALYLRELRDKHRLEERQIEELLLERMKQGQTPNDLHS